MRALYTLLACCPLLGFAACGDDTDDGEHGHVTMVFKPVAGTDAGIFNGTAEVRISVDYGDELRDFYLNDGNQWAYDGQKGAEVFAAWHDRLCDPGLAGVPDCSVLDISQKLESVGNSNAASLRIEYEIHNSDIELAKFYIGPIPKDAMIGGSSRVYITRSSAQGLDGDGKVLWEAKSYDPDNTGPGFAQGFSVDVGEPG